MPSSSRHIANLDAVRALAILLVIAFHAQYLAFGWIGVWIFFTLSGFLITRSLIPLTSGQFFNGLRIFYIRRTLRIWPAYYLYILIAAVLLLLGAARYDPVGQFWVTQFCYAAFYVFNIAPAFGGPTGGRIFSHLWSLAVEEQYYLAIAPIVLLLGRQRCVPLFIAGVLLSPIVRLLVYPLLAPGYGETGAAELVKLLTPLQFDSFMLGGLLALREDLITRLSTKAFVLVAGAILCLVTLTLVANDMGLVAQGRLGPDATSMDFAGTEQWRMSATSFGIAVNSWENMSYSWIYTILGLGSFGLIAAVIRLLKHVRVLVLNEIGKVSYGMYLYHMPLVGVFDRVMRRISVPKHSLLGWLFLIALVGVTWGVATLSYTWIERPFLRLKDRKFEPTRVLDTVSD